MTRVSRGKVRKRTWAWKGRKRVTWCFDVVCNGKRSRRQYTSQMEAETALDQYREEQRHGKPAEPSQPGPPLTLAEAVKRYIGVKARKRSLHTDRNLTQHLLAEFGAETPLAAITANRISDYKAKRIAMTTNRRKGADGKDAPLSAAAVNRPLALLRHLLRLACDEWGVLDTVPKIKTEKEPQGRLRWLTSEEATRLLAACKKSRNTALVDLVEFCLFTGVRKGEALGLTWDRVDRARGVIRLEVTKSGQRREVRSVPTLTASSPGAGQTARPATSSARANGIASATRGRRPSQQPGSRTSVSTICATRSPRGWCSVAGR